MVWVCPSTIEQHVLRSPHGQSHLLAGRGRRGGGRGGAPAPTVGGSATAASQAAAALSAIRAQEEGGGGGREGGAKCFSILAAFVPMSVP